MIPERANAMMLLRWWFHLRMFSGCVLVLGVLVGIGVGLWSLFSGDTGVGLAFSLGALACSFLIGPLTRWWGNFGAANRAFQQGQFAEAEEKFNKLRWAAESYHRLDPRRAMVDYALAEVYRAEARYAESAPLHREALALREELYGPESLQAAQSLVGLANVELDLCRYAEAGELYERALAVLLKRRGPDHPFVGVCLNNLGKLNGDQRHYGPAEEYYRRALAIWEARRNPDPATLALLLSNVASACWRLGKAEEAEALCRQALELFERARPAERRNAGLPLSNLAQALRLQRRYAEAESAARQALELWEEAYGAYHPMTASAVDALAKVYRDLGKLDLALSLCRRALATREAALEPNSADLVESRQECAALLRRLGRDREADELLTHRGHRPDDPTGIREGP